MAMFKIDRSQWEALLVDGVSVLKDFRPLATFLCQNWFVSKLATRNRNSRNFQTILAVPDLGMSLGKAEVVCLAP